MSRSEGRGVRGAGQSLGHAWRFSALRLCAAHEIPTIPPTGRASLGDREQETAEETDEASGGGGEVREGPSGRPAASGRRRSGGSRRRRNNSFVRGLRSGGRRHRPSAARGRSPTRRRECRPRCRGNALVRGGLLGLHRYGPHPPRPRRRPQPPRGPRHRTDAAGVGDRRTAPGDRRCTARGRCPLTTFAGCGASEWWGVQVGTAVWATAVRPSVRPTGRPARRLRVEGRRLRQGVGGQGEWAGRRGAGVGRALGRPVDRGPGRPVGRSVGRWVGGSVGWWAGGPVTRPRPGLSAPGSADGRPCRRRRSAGRSARSVRPGTTPVPARRTTAPERVAAAQAIP